MKQRYLQFRFCTLIVALGVTLGVSLPVSASMLQYETPQAAAVSNFSKNGTVSEVIHFSAEDFRVFGAQQDSLDSVIITSLPSQDSGILTMGGEHLASGDIVSVDALGGLCFTPLAAPTIASTEFTFIPVFQDGRSGEQVKVNLYLLTSKNNAPIAENLEFSTYKNIAYTGMFAAVDPEGDLLSFQLVDKPARGSISITENGNGEFVYTPYENKTGKDSFTYIAIDSMGNRSEAATVKVKIEKPSTKLTYADMEGHAAYNAAIRLAEEGIYIGASIDGTHYFQPDLPVSRSEFLTLAMTTNGTETLEGVTKTGFYDDDAIEIWAKPYISSALRSGYVQGTVSPAGQVVFEGDTPISSVEAAVILNRMLSITDVTAQVWNGNAAQFPSWASQAVMNLETVGVLRCDTTGSVLLADQLTRAEAAEMLAGVLNVLELRER